MMSHALNEATGADDDTAHRVTVSVGLRSTAGSQVWPLKPSAKLEPTSNAPLLIDAEARPAYCDPRYLKPFNQPRTIP